tara:strand:+ start:725 stop:1888 length:1164 start_codon:yes stop_codon:yes gene_type:complete
MKKSTLHTVLFSLSSLIAIGFLAYLTKQHIDLKTGRIIGGSLCNVSQTFNCDAVIASSFSEILGIPVSLWGMLSVLVAFIFYLIGTFFRSSLSYAYAKILTYFNFAVCIVYGLLAIAFLKTYCPFCLASYLFVGICALSIFLESKNIKTPPIQELITDLFKDNKIYLTGFVLIPLSALVLHRNSLGSAYLEMEKNAKFLVQSWQMAESKTFPSLQEAVKGEDDAIMEIVEFADFNCIHCKHAAPVLSAFVSGHPGVKLRFFHFPLDSRCNDAVSRAGVSCEMAKATFCAHKLSDNGWAIHDKFFQQERALDRANAIELVKSMSDVSDADLKECMESEETMDTIRAQAQLGVDSGVQGTPSIFVNGKPLRGAQYLPVLKAAYKEITSQ